MNLREERQEDLDPEYIETLKKAEKEIPISQRNKTIFYYKKYIYSFSSAQFRSVAQSCPTLCDPMNRSTSGLAVHHQLLEFTQTHVP